MSKFEEYADRYQNMVMSRREGILVIRLHSQGGPFQWFPDTTYNHDSIAEAFELIAADTENRIVILTGTGDTFIGPRADPAGNIYTDNGIEITAANVEHVHWANRRMINAILKVEVPIIAAVNGPAMRHSEIGVLCDIVLASETATFEDSGHFRLGGLVPGDGINIIYTMLLGINRARYFMLTGQVLSAIDAKALGVVSEILPQDQLLARATTIAQEILEKPPVVVRNTKRVLSEPVRQAYAQALDYSMALETIGVLSHREGQLSGDGRTATEPELSRE